MSNIDDYNKVVDFIGNIIKIASNPEDQEDINKTIDIVHSVGDVIKIISKDKNQE